MASLEAAYKALLASCSEHPVLFVHVKEAQTEGVAGACVRLFLHVYNKAAVEAEARANDSSCGCFCMRRFTGQEIAANEHDCFGSDFIILPGQAGNVSSQPSQPHPFFNTSMLFPFTGLEDKITFDLHNNLCCVPWSWQAVNHVTAFASKGVQVHKLARKQDDAGVVIQDPNAAAAAALKGLQDAAVGGGAAAASVTRDSATTWGLGLVEYKWIKCKDITRMTKGQVLIGSCVLPPKSILDQAELIQKTHNLPGDSLGIIEALIGHLVYVEIGASSACPGVLRVLCTVASWLGCSEAAPLCMLLHVTATHVKEGNISANHALSCMSSLLTASTFDPAEAALLPGKEQQLVSGMWNGVCDMFENLTHREHGLEFSLFHCSSAAPAPSTSTHTWLENVVQLIEFHQAVSVAIPHIVKRTQPSSAASVRAAQSNTSLSPSAARIVDFLKQGLFSYVEQLKERLLESATPFSHSVGDRTITISKETCFACSFCDSLAAVLDENIALSLNSLSKRFPPLISCIHSWAVLIMQHASNAAHPPMSSKSPAFVDSEYSFPWFVASFARITSFFKHSAFRGDEFSTNIELIDILKDVEDRTISSAGIWIDKYVHALPSLYYCNTLSGTSTPP